MGLENDSDWQSIYNGFHLPPSPQESINWQISIPGSFTQHTIRVYTNSLIAKPRWWFAGNLTQVIGDNFPIDFEASRWRIPLGRILLVQLPKVTATYRLKFEVPHWHKELAIVVEIYTGE